MKTTYLYIALALLILSEGIILWKNHQQKKEIALKDHYMERLVTSAQTMESAFQSSVENAGQQIYGNITARDTADNAIPLAEIALQAATSSSAATASECAVSALSTASA